MFTDRLRAAAEAGVLLGVKWALALALVIVMLASLLNDYNLVRTRSAHGQEAYDFIQQQIAAAKADAAKALPAPSR